MTEHIVPPKTYYVVALALFVLLVATVVVAEFDFGPLNTVVALGIAGLKALLIALYFMHLRYSIPLVRVVGFGALLWLAIGALLGMSDYLTRNRFEFPAVEGPRQAQPTAVDVVPFGEPVEPIPRVLEKQ